ncbi:hypothetical protein SDC9_151593 [bioreactor metagenome]|uniref:Uncharacterized protein n=1 Tax=bioreactor metagenome TaxID=1076179 RepID=A0A645ESD4_9ZZZZ
MDNHQEVDHPEEDAPVFPQVMADDIGIVVTGFALGERFQVDILHDPGGRIGNQRGGNKDPNAF